VMGGDPMVRIGGSLRRKLEAAHLSNDPRYRFP
jgi:hypothetical protein